MAAKKPRPGVYLLKFPEPGWVYVGASFASVHERIRGHFRRLRNNTHPNGCLRRAWNVYGRDGRGVVVVTRELPHVKDPAELQRYERRLMEHWELRIGWNRMLNHEQDPTEIPSQRPPEGL